MILTGNLEILPRLFSSVIIPPAVIAELRHADAPEAVKKWAEKPPSWIQIQAPENTNSFASLGVGESEAISLAMALRADVILLDDLAARDVAAAAGLKVAGTLGVLAQAHLRSWLDFETTLSKLRATNYRISDEAVERVRRKIRGG